ncbi:DUF4291 family protein [Streptomyces sp. NPDC058319]|uniref:DUF4291 family protein n=1 Tax=unclassified Streptomyces TaxID=2593676 RepID=UPI0036EBC68E
MPRFAVRARHTASTITVCQAYRPQIGGPAARDGRFPSTWKRDRMTWVIKPRSQTLRQDRQRCGVRERAGRL